MIKQTTISLSTQAARAKNWHLDRVQHLCCQSDCCSTLLKLKMLVMSYKNKKAELQLVCVLCHVCAQSVFRVDELIFSLSICYKDRDKC